MYRLLSLGDVCVKKKYNCGCWPVVLDQTCGKKKDVKPLWVALDCKRADLYLSHKFRQSIPKLTLHTVHIHWTHPLNTGKVSEPLVLISSQVSFGSNKLKQAQEGLLDHSPWWSCFSPGLFSGCVVCTDLGVISLQLDLLLFEVIYFDVEAHCPAASLSFYLAWEGGQPPWHDPLREILRNFDDKLMSSVFCASPSGWWVHVGMHFLFLCTILYVLTKDLNLGFISLQITFPEVMPCVKVLVGIRQRCSVCVESSSFLLESSPTSHLYPFTHN